jgi:hypothetical protein
MDIGLDLLDFGFVYMDIGIHGYWVYVHILGIHSSAIAHVVYGFKHRLFATRRFHHKMCVDVCKWLPHHVLAEIMFRNHVQHTLRSSVDSMVWLCM